jgi:hypothetical protein
MAYDPTELRLLVPTLNGNSGTPQLWSLQGTDAPTDVDAANFITDALARGMRKGDLVFYTQWDGAAKAAVSAVNVHAVATVAASGANLSLGVAVSMTSGD